MQGIRLCRIVFYGDVHGEVCTNVHQSPTGSDGLYRRAEYQYLRITA